MKLLAIACLISIFQDGFTQEHALFVRKEFLQSGRVKRHSSTTSADQMVQNILQWLQGVYSQNSRRIRQGTLREYLPPINTQKPRPFETTSPEYQTSPSDNNYRPSGYPPSGSITPQPPFPTFNDDKNYPSPNNDISPPEHNYPERTTSPDKTSTGYPDRTNSYTENTSTGYQDNTEGTSSSYPAGPDRTSEGNTYPTTGYQTTGYPSTGFRPSTTGYRPTTTTDYPSPSTGYLPSSTNQQETLQPLTSATNPEPASTIPSTETSESKDIEGSNVIQPEDGGGNHPPHIHAIDVECAKDMMTINIEFNREFNGVIYSKGYFSQPECRYVNENSEQTKYTFTVSLNSCGTEFVNAFDTQGQSYLENVLVLQNEPGIQEVWDTIRSVRCLWEGNLKESLSVALSVGMLSQEIVTFSGDTAMAKLDIQLGRGPFGQPANGLIKIGEPMTLVVSVSGDPGFDIQVKDCRATDSTGNNIVPLTDDNGCILKPKLFGAFQKTRDTGSSGVSIIAYAYFNAFKFPDVMDLMIECNIELCKTNCGICSDPNQKIEPGRRKRDLNYYNETLSENAIKMGKHLRIILPEDLSDNTVFNLNELITDEICVSTQYFHGFAAILISILAASSLLSAHLWLKNQRLKHNK